MGVSDRLLLRGLRKHIPEGATVLAIEVGSSDALGPRRKVTAVLTDDALLLATPLRTRTVLTTIPRADIRMVETVEPAVAAVTFDDYAWAIRRVVKLDLSRHRDRGGVIEALRQGLPRG